MARYKPIDYKQTRLLPVTYRDQLLPGTFERALCDLIDEEIDLSIFDSRFRNDETGAPAYDPGMLLKVVLFAYSRGIYSSRGIERACRENVVFMALSGDSQPHFTTIAHFISTLDREIGEIFREVLLICDDMGLIGREMFAIDGCKLPSNASKEWSGTHAQLAEKVEKIDKSVHQMLKRHREMDASETDTQIVESEKKRAKKLKAKAKKIRKFLSEHKEKMGSRGKPVQSNVTDNDSAKMMTSHGVVQGYDGIATVDAKHQVIVHAEAYGNAQENGLLQPMIEGTRETLEGIGSEDSITDTTITADAGFHSEPNMKYLAEQGLDAVVADNRFRKRDPVFKRAQRYKPKDKKRKWFGPTDFDYDPQTQTCTCPAGKDMWLRSPNARIRGHSAAQFEGRVHHCRACKLRKQCLQKPEKTVTRQVCFFSGIRDGKESFTKKMIRKLDTLRGRWMYGRRLGTVEPVFGNIRHTKRLDRFTLRGKRKVNAQWLLYCLVHNIEKVQRYGLVGG